MQIKPVDIKLKFLATVILAVVLAMGAALPMRAQDVVGNETGIDGVETADAAEGSLANDAAAPDWYVAPVIPENKRAPRRSLAAASCTVDSVVTYDENEKPTAVSCYEFDDAGRAISTAEWIYESDGARVGKSKQEYGFNAAGTQVMTATYAWDKTTNNWLGTEKSEYVYDEEERIISNTEYAWISNVWVADNRYTYVFDNAGREKEFTTYTRDANNQLVYSKCRIQEWDDADNQILDIQYTAYSGGAWSAGTKKIWAYDENGNKTEYTYYSKITNHSWVGSSRELWTYDENNKKTKYEKYAWSNGDWIGASKEEWEYTSGKKTLYAKYSWSNGAWVGVSKEVWGFESGKDKLYEKYTWNSAWACVERKDWTYNAAGKKTLYEYKKLESGAWVVYEQEICAYDASNNQTKSEKYVLTNGALVGTLKETWEYTSSKKTKHNKFTWGDSDWEDSEEEIWAYTSGKETNYEKYVWESGVKVGRDKRTSEYTLNKLTLQQKYTWESGNWIIAEKEVWAYISSKQTLYEKYTAAGGELVGVEKEEWAYSGGQLTGHAKYMWFSDAWAVSEGEAYDAAGNQTLIEQYTLNATGTTRSGLKKEEYEFNEAGNVAQQKIYSSWNKTQQIWGAYAFTCFDAAGNKIETCGYKWSNGAWVGNGTRSLKTYDSGNEVDDILQKWKSGAWVNTSRRITSYSGSKMMQKVEYLWSNDAWVESVKEEHHYNAEGLKDGEQMYLKSGDEWVNASRIIYSFDSRGNTILKEEDVWQNDAWVMSSMEKTDIISDAKNRQLLYAKWKCGSDAVWKGVQKDTVAYSATDKKIYEAHYTSWSNGWVGSPNVESKVEWKYDDADRMILRQSFDWINGGWQGHTKDESAFDSRGNTLMEAHYGNWIDDWVGTGGYKNTYAYDDANRKINNTKYTWKNGGWQLQFSYNYEFDASGHQVMELVQQYVNGEWANSEKHEKEYRGSKLVKDNDYTWSAGQWSIYRQNETYYDNDSKGKLRREISGSWSGGVVQLFTDNHYFYNCDDHYFTVRFTNYDGTLLASDDVLQGDLPVYSGATPTREADAEYTYTFVGWDKTIVAVTGDVTYNATFNSTKNKYTITWLNEDGTQIDQTQVEYGAVPTHADAVKPATAQHTFAFAGWDKEIVAVTGEATYKATFTSTVNKYTITWVDGDGKTIATEQVAYGETPTYTGDTPTKTATAEHTYEFNDTWSPAIVPVTGDATYTALFIEAGVHPSTVIITYVDDEGNVLFYEMYNYGQTPDPATPGKTSTAQYDYTFTGWSPAIAPATSDVTYTATYSATVRSYTIKFVNDDGKVLYSEVLEYGQMPEYVGDTPAKAEDKDYTYSFSGWTPEISMVVGKATYTATYTATKKVGTGLADTDSDAPVTKVMENGILYILRNGQKYTTTGAPVR